MSLYTDNYRNILTPELDAAIEQGAALLEAKILKLDIDALEISDYNKNYFKDYLKKLRYSLQAAGFIIANGFRDNNLKKESTVFLDYGGGIGIVALLAKQIGIGTVIYNDIYEVSCHDAGELAKVLDLKAKHYIPGGIEEVTHYLNINKINLNIFSSRNVIEHIYNLEEFFEKSEAISSTQLVLVHATTANIHNPLVNIYTKRIHKKAEYKINNVKWKKDRDALKPYLEIRKDIIKEKYPQLDATDIFELATRTRGKIKEDIFSIVEKYIITKQLPAFDSNDTNTCDPYTGNWAEHLIPVKMYEKLMEKCGFHFKIIPGFYSTSYASSIINPITKMANKVIIKNRMSINLAPFIILMGNRN